MASLVLRPLGTVWSTSLHGLCMHQWLLGNKNFELENRMGRGDNGRGDRLLATNTSNEQ